MRNQGLNIKQRKKKMEMSHDAIYNRMDQPMLPNILKMSDPAQRVTKMKSHLRTLDTQKKINQTYDKPFKTLKNSPNRQSKGSLEKSKASFVKFPNIAKSLSPIREPEAGPYMSRAQLNKFMDHFVIAKKYASNFNVRDPTPMAKAYGESEWIIKGSPIKKNEKESGRSSIQSVQSPLGAQQKKSLFKMRESVPVISSMADLDQSDGQQSGLTTVYSNRNLFSSTSSQTHDNSEEEGLVGEEALINYYKKCKNYEKIIEKEKAFNKEKISPLVEFLEKTNKLKVSPKGLGFVNRKGNPFDINLQSFYMGDSYADAMADGLKINKHTKKINLGRNRLGDKGLLSIIKTIPKCLKRLDLSGNPLLGIKAYIKIAELIENSSYALEYLSIESNMAGDNNIKTICEAISYDDSLRFLNISKNQISDIGASHVSKMIAMNTSLQVLFLHWNKIRGKGGEEIIRSLSEKNRVIQIFDISFNAIGGHQKCAEQLKNMFLQNNVLKHLDLSHDGLKEIDVIAMGEGLRENHTLLGIHMVGNDADTDCNGFINPTKSDIAATHVFSRISAELNMGRIHSQRLIGLRASSNCWICEGWTQIKFIFDPAQFSIGPEEPVFLHISPENYIPDLMLKDKDNPDVFSQLRMVPPGKIKYYYSIGEQEKTIVTDSNLPVKKKKNQNVRVKGEENEMEVPETNIIEKVIQTKQLVTETIIQNMECLPRPPPKELARIIKLKTPWDFFKSVFKDYKPDNEALLVKTFLFDWDCSKLSKIIKDPQEMESVKSYLKDNYKHFREIYKFYSAISPAGPIFSIGSNVFSDIISNCDGLVDNRSLKLSDLDFNLVATNAGAPKKKNNPDRQLVRYQFMEVFVRLAQDKFIKSGQTKSALEAMKQMMNEFLIPYFSTFDCHKWRLSKLWNEDNDLVYKRYVKVMNKLYEKFSGKFALPGAANLEEFSDMVLQSGVVDDSFGQREIASQFNLAMMTQKDELDSDKHMNMTMPEFIEAIGRVAEKIAVHDPFIEADDIVKSKKFPFYQKIESFLFYLMKTCLPKSFSDDYEAKLRKQKLTEANAPKKTKHVVAGGPYAGTNSGIDTSALKEIK